MDIAPAAQRHRARTTGASERIFPCHRFARGGRKVTVLVQVSAAEWKPLGHLERTSWMSRVASWLPDGHCFAGKMHDRIGIRPLVLGVSAVIRGGDVRPVAQRRDAIQLLPRHGQPEPAGERMCVESSAQTISTRVSRGQPAGFRKFFPASRRCPWFSPWKLADCAWA